MTPQERAAFVNTMISRVYQNVDDHGCLQYPEEVEAALSSLIAERDTATRRAALLEAAEFLKLMPMLTKDNAIAVLTRFAQEG